MLKQVYGSYLETKYEWMNEESCRKQSCRQQTCPLTIHFFNIWTVSSDVSIQRRHGQPLSVHLWAYCIIRPTHDVNDLMCERWCGFFYVPQEQDTCKCSGTRPTVFRPYPYPFAYVITKAALSSHLSYLKTVSVGPAGVWTCDLPLSRPALSQI